MEFWAAVLLFLLAVAGIVLSAVCLRRKKVLRIVCIIVCSLAAAALAAASDAPGPAASRFAEFAVKWVRENT